MGLDDAAFIAARSAPRVIGVIGAHNAGKTTLLTAWYLLLNRGMRLPHRLFAGSNSIGGWENLAHWLRWPPNGNGPGFPPHTPIGDERAPGLLHLAFRRDDGLLEDVLVTDAPGEWFERWAVKRDDPGAEGARWTVRHADAFLLVVDCEELAGPRRGTARSQTIDLAKRLADEASNLPVAVVWAKSDVSITPQMRNTLEAAFSSALPGYQNFEISIQGTGEEANARRFMDVLSSTLAHSPQQVGAPLVLPLSEKPDFFLRYRGT